ncbi:hypothetical protein PV755_46565 [Streptomyces caniscabiei]|uniref:Uncharacterized protein n=1 Tax=Streptomyces caniscabiei TaxID=2746961 RepID=A0A927LD36_9ACTN|nr:hypothetical protein [Streptomyces caniscabiei]MBD9730192.1 hypothetical protein [Streptomyces caniscabiei]MDX3516269.1 hypothetical protein [Streptomyces caniscabiei]MDX3725266.1 hypothetical protein [Streptomyces caniscabiei]WEO25169.1 hypothetical protein IHE65_19395 [Streptomyces caniscabiei]WEO26321.1 hypothetical protein IHE65_25920 [Streptomyces caniscabiei]
MTSHVEEQIQARIAAVAAKKQQQREERAEFARQRAAGLKSRKHSKLRRVFCGSCAKLQRKGSYLRCPLGCGTALCRSRPGCGNSHLRQCPNRCSQGNSSEAS